MNELTDKTSMRSCFSERTLQLAGPGPGPWALWSSEEIEPGFEKREQEEGHHGQQPLGPTRVPHHGPRGASDAAHQNGRPRSTGAYPVHDQQQPAGHGPESQDDLPLHARGGSRLAAAVAVAEEEEEEVRHRTEHEREPRAHEVGVRGATVAPLSVAAWVHIGGDGRRGRISGASRIA